MTLSRPIVLALGLWLAAVAGPAAAMAVAGPAGTAEQGRRLVPDVPAAAVAPALDLFAARLDAVDLAGGKVTVRGQQVPLHPTQLRVLGQGGQVLGARSLRTGQAVRLALEPQAPAAAAPAASAATASARRVVLIYIDGSP
jgi:hypothetical protein